MSGRGIGDFKRIFGHVRGLSAKKSDERQEPPLTPRTSERRRVTIEPHSNAPLTPRSVAADRPANAGSKDDASVPMSSSAPPKRPPPKTPIKIGGQEWEETFDDLLAGFDELEDEAKRLAETETVQSVSSREGGPGADQRGIAAKATPSPPPNTTTTTSTATTTTAAPAPRPNWQPPPVRATITIQPDIEHVRYEQFDGEKFIDLGPNDPSLSKGIGSPKADRPTIATRQETPPLPNTTTTTTTTTTSTEGHVSDNLPREVKIHEITKDDIDLDIEIQKDDPPIPPEKPARLQRPKIPTLNLATATGTAEKSGTKMFPEFKQARPGKTNASKLPASNRRHARTDSDQQGKEPAKESKKVFGHRRMFTDLPTLGGSEAPRIGDRAPRTSRPEPSESVAPVSPRQPKPLPQPARYSAALEKKRQSVAKPSERKPDIDVPPASPRPDYPSDRDDVLSPKAKGPDPSREKPGNQN